MINSLVENQINSFISNKKIKYRKILSQAFGMQCEKIILDNGKSYIIKYYISKKEKFNSIVSETSSLLYLLKKNLNIFPKIYFYSDDLLITEYINHNNFKNKNY